VAMLAVMSHTNIGVAQYLCWSAGIAHDKCLVVGCGRGTHLQPVCVCLYDRLNHQFDHLVVEQVGW